MAMVNKGLVEEKPVNENEEIDPSLFCFFTNRRGLECARVILPYIRVHFCFVFFFLGRNLLAINKRQPGGPTPFEVLRKYWLSILRYATIEREEDNYSLCIYLAVSRSVHSFFFVSFFAT